MKVIKRNQLIILIIGLMLVTAGYLNFLGGQDALETAANTRKRKYRRCNSSK